MTNEEKINGTYYLTKTIEDKWGVALWDKNKWWADNDQNGKTLFGIKDEWIKEFYLLPSSPIEVEKEKIEFAISKCKEFRECAFGKGINVIKELEDKLTELKTKS